MNARDGAPKRGAKSRSPTEEPRSWEADQHGWQQEEKIMETVSATCKLVGEWCSPGAEESSWHLRTISTAPLVKTKDRTLTFYGILKGIQCRQEYHAHLLPMFAPRAHEQNTSTNRKALTQSEMCDAGRISTIEWS